MAQLSNLLLKLSRELFPDRTERDLFVSALMHPRPCDGYLFWCQPKQQTFELRAALDWQPEFVDRLAPGQQPEKHVLFQQGAYDSVEFTALFMASVLLSLSDRPGLVFDLCAGTGSNSVFAWQLLQPKLLLANTLIRQHHRPLLGHLRRCGITPAAMMSVDSGVLAEVIPATADLVIVDAPSSAQSVLARGRLNPGCFHPVTITKYAKCQRRLLTNAARLVAPQGYLLYITRTYSLDENEQVLDWFLDRFSQFVPCVVPHLSPYQSRFTPRPAYRLFPQDHLPNGAWGLGGFTTLLQNTDVGLTRSLSPQFLTQPRISMV